nr:unnamed protein product [Callosobruchus chinensis]
MSKKCDQSARERMTGGGSRAPVYAAGVAVCVGAVCTGIALAWTNNASEKLEAGQLNGIIIEKMDLHWTAVMMTIGCCVATLPVALALDTFGRKTTMMLATLPLYIGYTLILFARHKYMIFVGRFVPERQELKNTAVRRGLIISITVLLLKHLVGANQILTFTGAIVNSCGFSNAVIKWSVVIGGLIRVYILHLIFIQLTVV